MIGLVDSGGANICSLLLALKSIGAEVVLSDHPKDLEAAERILLPGVGSAGVCMQRLQKNDLTSFLKQLRVPVLGICIGMQLQCEYLEEGQINGLKIVEGRVEEFSRVENFPVPHMGWNRIKVIREDPLLEGLDQQWFYFAHSYRLAFTADSLALTEYSEEFSSVIRKDNWYGVQFHPEKSGWAGLKLLDNFVKVNL